MLPETRTRSEERGPEPAAAERLPPCPLCAGGLVLLHDHYRCSRCRFSLCVGCDALEVCSLPGQ
jgi:hypothetical protein